jgi:iron(III) transport system permease protein
MSPGVYVAALMVLVDVMKEMPATLLLRPFGWDTLAIKIFELTSEGEWEQAAVPALILVLVAMIPVVYLLNKTAKTK